MICFDAAVDCGTPSSPECMDIDIPGGTMYQDIVIYTCKNCCESNGMSGESICRRDGTWSDQALECTRK